MTKRDAKTTKPVEQLAEKATSWIGSIPSIIVHTIFFVAVFALGFIGFNTEQILLILTTVVSLEAIYLAIFIQMTVNRNTESLEEVEEDIEEITEELGEVGDDIEGIEKNVEELSEEVEEISEDIDKLQEEDEREEARTEVTIEKIERMLQLVLQDLDNLKQNQNEKKTQLLP